MPADHYVMDTDLKAVADAIRTKGGTTAPLQFPNGMVQAINNIQTGGGGFEYAQEYVKEISSYALYKIDNLTAVKCPRVHTVRNQALSYCDMLTSIDLPEVTLVEDWSMSNNNALVSVNMPNVTEIMEYAFTRCPLLTSLNIPNTNKIGWYVFSSCGSLVTVDLLKITSISHYAFEYCKSMTKLIIRTPDRVCTAGTLILYHSDNCQIYVPDNLVEQYKTATNWSKYASRIHPISEIEGGGDSGGGDSGGDSGGGGHHPPDVE